MVQADLRPKWCARTGPAHMPWRHLSPASFMKIPSRTQTQSAAATAFPVSKRSELAVGRPSSMGSCVRCRSVARNEGSTNPAPSSKTRLLILGPLPAAKYANFPTSRGDYAASGRNRSEINAHMVFGRIPAPENHIDSGKSLSPTDSGARPRREPGPPGRGDDRQAGQRFRRAVAGSR